jgi:FtsP/CotA-like multicopper oxidase with cupredoxin domain
MHGGMGHMMQRGSAPFVLSDEVDIDQLNEAEATEIRVLEDGATIDLSPTVVRGTLGGKETTLLGYSGKVPGPILKVQQGSTFRAIAKNNTPLPTTIHWHGVRVENRFDGVPNLTQSPIEPEETATYTVHVPDEGLYWYHPHVREDLQQDLGLYGALWVTPRDTTAYAPVHREEVLMLDDVLLQNGEPLAYGGSSPDFALMGRFGNTLLINGQTSYALTVEKKTVVRFLILNAASTRTFRLAIPDATMKLVGSDGGRLPKEQFVESVTLAPSERAIVDVLFQKSGEVPLLHTPPAGSIALGTITVEAPEVAPSHIKEFQVLHTNTGVQQSIDAYRASFAKEPDATLTLNAELEMPMHHGMQAHADPTGIEWEDPMPMMNAAQNGDTVQWKIIDEETERANADLELSFKKGSVVKLRITNPKDAAHPMQHPMHLHGQRFLVMDERSVPRLDLGWKDTVLVPVGKTLDLLVPMENSGMWMLHCHIAEHFGSGMMTTITVEE